MKKNDETKFVITRINDPDELMHYGVPGMKWGHRKSLPTSSLKNKVDSAKTDYKNAKKAFNKSFNDAYKHRAAAYSFSKERRKANDVRWAKNWADANKLETAKTTYKKAKSERKQKIKDTYKSLNKSASLGEKLTYNNATRKKAVKYVVDNGMTVEKAKSRANKDAIRNTGAMLAVYGTVAAASLYKMNH